MHGSSDEGFNTAFTEFPQHETRHPSRPQKKATPRNPTWKVVLLGRGRQGHCKAQTQMEPQMRLGPGFKLGCLELNVYRLGMAV